MRSGTGSILWAMGIGLLFWVGGKVLLPLCFPFLLGTGLALAAEPAVRLLLDRVPSRQNGRLRSVPIKAVLPPELIVRGSVADIKTEIE